MNLCTNAMQAVPAGGMLSVRLERLHVAAPRVLSHSPLSAGDHLALSVSDRGGGIAPDVMNHLFEPFFTTRAAQSGTGLGLAVVFGIVAEFGGAIDVASAPGHGARFTLYLPECTELPGRPEPLPDEAPGGTGQRLLVVDDDPELVALAEEMLRGLGYDPVGCSDSTTAWQLLRDEPQRFAAVITDEVMPRLSGIQLTRALWQHSPHLPVLLISGHGGALLAQRAAVAGVTGCLPSRCSPPILRTPWTSCCIEAARRRVPGALSRRWAGISAWVAWIAKAGRAAGIAGIVDTASSASHPGRPAIDCKCNTVAAFRHSSRRHGADHATSCRKSYVGGSLGPRRLSADNLIRIDMP